MREMLRLAATAGALLALPALAAPPPSGAAAATPSASRHEPFSLRASNIVPADTKSEIAPSLPAPPDGDFATVPMLLHDARVALVNKQTGAAQEALERAETRLLDRSVPLGSADQPDRSPAVAAVADARLALGHNDLSASIAGVDKALHDVGPNGAGLKT